MTKLTTASYVKITLIIALGLLILGSIGFGGCSAMRFGMRGGTEMGSANVDAASGKNLSVKWASGAVNIDVVDEGDAIELVETAPRGMTKAQQMRWSVNGDTLSIDYGTWFSCFALGRKDLQVRIPKSYAQNLGAVEIDGASGDYDVNGLGCETLKLKLASGDVRGRQHQQRSQQHGNDRLDSHASRRRERDAQHRGAGGDERRDVEDDRAVARRFARHVGRGRPDLGILVAHVVGGVLHEPLACPSSRHRTRSLSRKPERRKPVQRFRHLRHIVCASADDAPAQREPSR